MLLAHRAYCVKVSLMYSGELNMYVIGSAWGAMGSITCHSCSRLSNKECRRWGRLFRGEPKCHIWGIGYWEPGSDLASM